MYKTVKICFGCNEEYISDTRNTFCSRSCYETIRRLDKELVMELLPNRLNDRLLRLLMNKKVPLIKENTEHFVEYTMTLGIGCTCFSAPLKINGLKPKNHRSQWLGIYPVFKGDRVQLSILEGRELYGSCLYLFLDGFLIRQGLDIDYKVGMDELIQKDDDSLIG